jgi:hypothetical protein
MRIQAKALWVKLNPDRADEFKCSDTYLRNFFKAHAIVTRRASTSAPKLAEDPEKMRTIFLCRIAFIAQKKNVAPSLIFYADESGVFLMPNKATTLDFKGIKNVPVAFSRAFFYCLFIFIYLILAKSCRGQASDHGDDLCHAHRGDASSAAHLRGRKQGARLPRQLQVRCDHHDDVHRQPLGKRRVDAGVSRAHRDAPQRADRRR